MELNNENLAICFHKFNLTQQRNRNDAQVIFFRGVSGPHSDETGSAADGAQKGQEEG